MFGVVKVLGSMLVLGRVATGRMSADQAHTQVNPRIARLNAVFTHMLVGLSYFDLVKVSAFFGHRFLLLFMSDRNTNSFCDEQVLGKGPLFVNPLCLADEAGLVRHLEDLSRRVLVAALGPDGLTLEKLDAQIRRRNAHRLPPLGLQMHFNAPGVVINPGDVSELAQVKIGIELAIDPGQQVEVKSRGHSDVIVVGLEQLRNRLLQVCAQQKRISGFENTPNPRQEFNSGETIEISNGAPQKEHEEVLPALPVRGHLQQPVKIFALKTYDADRINVTELALAPGQSRAGYFDRIIKCASPAA
jgi:hypothetical protein